MSNPTVPRPDGSDRGPGRELYRRCQEISSQNPVTGTKGSTEPPDSTEQEQLGDENNQHLNSTPSLSTAPTLVDAQSNRQSDELHISRSQHSLARPLEEASYSPWPSPPGSSQPSKSPYSNAAGSDGAVSQHSLARPLEEATYAQDNSQPPSEPASPQPPSTQSSGAYMPLPFLRLHHAEQRLDHFNNATSPSLPASPTIEFPETSLNVPQASGSEGVDSVYSLAHPVAELHSRDASPPASLLVEDSTGMITSFSQHTLTLQLEDLRFADDMETDYSPPMIRTADSNATSGSQVDQAMDDLVSQQDSQRNSGRITRRALTPQRLEALRTYRLDQRMREVVGDYDDTAAPEVTSSAKVVSSTEVASSQHILARPLVDTVTYELSEVTEPDPSPRVIRRRRRPPSTWRCVPLTRQNAELTAQRGDLQPREEDGIVASDLATEAHTSANAGEARINSWLELTEPRKTDG